MVDWTIKELRELLEMIEEGGDGDKIVRFDYDGEKYQLDWPVTFERGKVKRELFSLDEEVIYVNKDTADFMIRLDFSSLSDEDKVRVGLDSLEEVRQMIIDYDNSLEEEEEE